MMQNPLGELAESRQRWIDANRENNFEEGIKRLLTELYPDNAHFIYELLQNAEDPRANEVRFTLSDKEIEFEHNGERLFDLKDVESITSIGVSTKRDDPTSIGKFGVGFKAVFAYTNTPEIHSGEFHFRIQDLVLPVTTGVNAPVMGERKTYFIFPFDHTAKRPERAVEEIEDGLRSLGDNTLLFLSHINKLEYLLPDGSLGSFERIAHEDGHIEIRTSHPDSEDTVSHWLRFQKEVEIVDEDGKLKSCRIAVAYKLDENDGKNKNLKKNSPPWKITPLDNGQVSIFFPAEKETSNLKFHLHAPFASTVARDSVRDCEANRQLRDCLAELVADSLIDIRDKGMLTMEFFAVLPIEADNLSPFYEPVRETIVRAFNEERLTLTRDGSYAPATELYRGPKRIDDVLNAEGLSLLTNVEPWLWVANPPQQNQRDDRFLDSLELDSWGWEELSWALNSLDEDDQEAFELWIAKKNDAWMRGFYALLGEASDVHEEYVEMENFRIVRIESDQGDEHVLPKDAFFLPEPENNLPEGICFVKPSVYMTKAKKKYARLFLEEIGVRDFDEKAVIEYTLKNYTQKPTPSQKKHLEDMKHFLNYWQKDRHCIAMFRNCAFLMGCDGKYHKAQSLFIDQPYMDTGLDIFFNCDDLNLEKRKLPVSEKYFEFEGFKEFAVELGVMTTLEVVEHQATEMQSDSFRIKGNRTGTTIDVDYFINGLGWYQKGSDRYFGMFKLNRHSPFSLCRVVWLTMCAADPKELTARYLPNASRRNEEQKEPSYLVSYLKNKKWVPDRSGKLCLPKEVSDETLHPSFEYDDRNGWLTAIGFGSVIRRHSEEYLARNSHAQNMGFESAEEEEVMAQIAQAMRECGKSPDEILEQLRPISEQGQPSFPSKPVANQERRQERLGEQLFDAPEKENEKRERSVRTTRGAVDPASWLRNQYTNESGKMVCQICEKEHFRKRDGEHYFEAVEALSRDFFPKEHEAQFLALCPLCAAMYKEFVKKDEGAMADLKMELSDADDSVVPLKLGDLETNIRFVETHYCDLKVIIDE